MVALSLEFDRHEAELTIPCMASASTTTSTELRERILTQDLTQPDQESRPCLLEEQAQWPVGSKATGLDLWRIVNGGYENAA